ncbi:RNA recognition motif protein [Gregarina niphandrodes]|uniref:RNA recognition motif protein n=1 Tax=Gregarina niphandrodes TaxID=110365 RepID=A0A023BCC8_GRENI|nr:RNA recognition motif protein [Gregarina niphandrodes]EZG83734.1 RNA recognition motif protein [Gregarina niphandrodes]|eukprot:XP_011128912.1 RNA recognition motif protein [Gregarina niphandrodes]
MRAGESKPDDALTYTQLKGEEEEELPQKRPLDRSVSCVLDTPKRVHTATNTEYTPLTEPLSSPGEQSPEKLLEEQRPPGEHSPGEHPPGEHRAAESPEALDAREAPPSPEEAPTCEGSSDNARSETADGPEGENADGVTGLPLESTPAAQTRQPAEAVSTAAAGTSTELTTHSVDGRSLDARSASGRSAEDRSTAEDRSAAEERLAEDRRIAEETQRTRPRTLELDPRALEMGPRGSVENTTLWIGDLERWEDEEYIYAYFEQYFPQSVTSVKVARDKDQQRSLGYGFVDFCSREVAERVLAAAPVFKRSHGRRFKLTWARGKTRQPFNPARRGLTASGGVIHSAPHLGPGAHLAPHLGPSSLAPSSHFAGSQFGLGPLVPAPAPAPFVPGGARWCVDVPKLPAGCSHQRLLELVLKPLALEGCTILEPYDGDSVRLVFAAANAFFAFIARYRDWRIDLAGLTLTYAVPADVMDSWTRMYEQSVTGANADYQATPQWQRM